jgi:hypothetical protein
VTDKPTRVRVHVWDGVGVRVHDRVHVWDGVWARIWNRIGYRFSWYFTLHSVMWDVWDYIRSGVRERVFTSVFRFVLIFC